MAATLLASYQLSVDPTFRVKVLTAIATAALAVHGETPSNPANTIKDAKRSDLAFGVISNANGYLDRFALLVASRPGISSNATDNDIQFSVNEVWNDVAGYTGL